MEGGDSSAMVGATNAMNTPNGISPGIIAGQKHVSSPGSKLEEQVSNDKVPVPGHLTSPGLE